MKRITTLASIALIALSTFTAQAQFIVQADSTRTSNVKLFQSNIGITGYNMVDHVGGIEWPRGSGNQFLFGGGVWLGSAVDRDASSDSLVFLTYNPNSGSSWATPGSTLLHLHVNGFEQFQSTFSDFDLQNYEGSADRRREQGFPLGVQFSQVLTTGGDGIYRDAFSLTTTITNINESRILRDLVLGMALDVDVGWTGAESRIGHDDKVRFLQARNGPIVQVYDSLQPSVGVMGVAMVNSPQAEGFYTCTIWPNYGLEFTDDLRYKRLVSGVMDTTTYEKDVRLIVGHRPTVLVPGETISVTVLFMFAASMSEETDQRMIELVDTWGVQSSVDEEVPNTALKIYPNPARASDVIHIESNALITRAELVNVLGEVVATSTTEPEMISAGSVPQGWYLIRAYTGTGVVSQAIVIAN